MSVSENAVHDSTLVLGASAAEPEVRRIPSGLPLGAIRVALIVPIAFWLFLVGLGAMKSGAQALAPTLEGSMFTDSLPSALGLGWLSAMLVMSGSPIAASSLALLDGGSLSRDQTFMALTGSRLGAAFVVLTVAFLYAVRGSVTSETKRASLSIGLFALILTAVVYLPGAAVGMTLLDGGALDSLGKLPLSETEDVVASLTGPALSVLKDAIPGGLLFLVGVGVLLSGLKLLDAVLPTPRAGSFAEEGWREKRWVMFAIGSAVAFVTMSVSVALTVLVPAVAKGYIRRRHAIAYIAGANITTLADTLVTAVLLGNPDAVRVVAAELIGVSAVTILLLLFAYGTLEARLLAVTDWLLGSRRRLGGFVVAMFTVPLILIAIL